MGWVRGELAIAHKRMFLHNWGIVLGEDREKVKITKGVPRPKPTIAQHFRWNAEDWGHLMGR